MDPGVIFHMANYLPNLPDVQVGDQLRLNQHSLRLCLGATTNPMAQFDFADPNSANCEMQSSKSYFALLVSFPSTCAEAMFNILVTSASALE